MRLGHTYNLGKCKGMLVKNGFQATNFAEMQAGRFPAEEFRPHMLTIQHSKLKGSIALKDGHSLKHMTSNLGGFEFTDKKLKNHFKFKRSATTSHDFEKVGSRQPNSQVSKFSLAS